MAEEFKTIRETEVQSGNATQRTTEINDPAARDEHTRNVGQRIVWYIAGVIITLLVIRFVFALLGANEGNGIAEFIYGVTGPFVSPFTNLFAFDGVEYGVSRLEIFTLVSIAFYTIVAYGISQLFNLNRR